MRIIKTIVILAVLHFTVIGCSTANTENPWDRKLPFETAIIEYSLSGTQTGTATLYIKNYGKDRAKHTNAVTKMLFMKVQSNTVEFTTPDVLTNFDLKERTGVSTPNPLKKYREDFEKLTDSEKDTVNKNIKLLSEKGLDIFAGGSGEKKEGDFLGQKVDIVDMNGLVVWSLKGTDIPVKSSMSIMGMTTNVVATKISLDVDIPEDKFNAPAGITATSNPYADQMSQDVAGSMFNLEALKDPKFEEKIDAYIAEMKKEQQKQQSMMGGAMPPRAMPVQ